MKKLLLMLANLIAFCSAMRSWQFNFTFFRFYIFDLLSLIFIGILFLYYAVNNKSKPFLLPKELKHFIIFKWGWLIIIAISSIAVIFWGEGQEAFIQYYKGGIDISFHTIFIVLFIIFLSNITLKEQNRILKTFILGVIASSVYELFQLSLYVLYDINLDSYIWNQISYNTAYSFDAFKAWEVGGIVRVTGFAGTNATATYIVTVLPFLLLISFYNKKISNLLLTIIAIMGLLLTMSRTGIVSFAAALLFLVLLEHKRLFNILETLLIVMVPFGFLGYIWRDSIAEILPYRIYTYSGRIDLFEHAINLFYSNPILGVGYNNYFVNRDITGDILLDQPNVHNSWLTILLELGIIGLLFQITFIVYMIYAASKKKSILSRAFVCTIIGLSVGAFFNQLFDLFYIEFYFALCFTIIASERVLNNPAKIAAA